MFEGLKRFMHLSPGEPTGGPNQAPVVTPEEQITIRPPETAVPAGVIPTAPAAPNVAPPVLETAIPAQPQATGQELDRTTSPIPMPAQSPAPEIPAGAIVYPESVQADAPAPEQTPPPPFPQQGPENQGNPQ